MFFDFLNESIQINLSHLQNRVRLSCHRLWLGHLLFGCWALARVTILANVLSTANSAFRPTSGPESNLEAFNYYPADGSYGTLPYQVMPDQISEIKVPLVLIYISLCWRLEY